MGNTKPPIFVLVRKLEAQCIPTTLAEDITDGFCDCLDNLAPNVVFKVELKMSDMMYDLKFSKFKSEVQSSQERSQREIEKFRNDIEKLRIDMRYEIDKVIAGHRLDLNLEHGTSIVLEDCSTTSRRRVFHVIGGETWRLFCGNIEGWREGFYRWILSVEVSLYYFGYK
ncbi:uncharacterized protein LOC143859358 isoform X2 [Tasmannia lanceolata]|uniref:uncharacterized protein LOC143859353 isoform X2 n=1 Tax=Tasmannia lanceolata TaxID=3420 RepID=UPI004063323D